MLDIDEALTLILDAVDPLGPERVELGAALGRSLAEPIVAREDAPPFDASAMDGWAIRSAELASASADAPIVLPIRGESRAGGGWPDAHATGTTMRIFTGAPLPAGADAVVMQENVERDGERACFRGAAKAGAHVRARGEDLRAGEVILAAGATIGSGEIALLASQSVGAVAVHRAPIVAILTNGDELRELGDAPRAGSIVDANAPAIAAAVREAGGLPIVLPRAPDQLEALTARVREGLRADVLVLCGGVSVGDHDLAHLALEAAGVAPRFWKVRIKPGKPLVFGLHDRTPVFGLPGNPVSAWVTFEIFVRPALRRMQGDPRPFRGTIEVELDAPHRHATGRTELARATLEWSDGRARARLFAKQGSGSTQSIAGADALVILPADVERFAQGARLRAIPLASPRAAVSPFH